MNMIQRLKQKIIRQKVLKALPWILWMILVGIQLTLGIADPKSPPPDPPGC